MIDTPWRDATITWASESSSPSIGIDGTGRWEFAPDELTGLMLDAMPGWALAWDRSARRFYRGTSLLTDNVPGIFEPADDPSVIYVGTVTAVLWLVFGDNAQVCTAASPFTPAVGDWYRAGNTVEGFGN